jgi:hypothetical protein
MKLKRSPHYIFRNYPKSEQRSIVTRRRGVQESERRSLTRTQSRAPAGGAFAGRCRGRAKLGRGALSEIHVVKLRRPIMLNLLGRGWRHVENDLAVSPR